MFSNLFVPVFNQSIKRLPIRQMVYEASTSTSAHRDLDKDARSIFSSAISAVLPDKMISKHVKFSPEDNVVTVDKESYKVRQNVYIVGFGKAVCGMACKLNKILHEHIVKGILSIPAGMQQALKDAGKISLLPDNPRILLCEGATNNLPDNEAHQTAVKIKQLVISLKKTDILFVLISGGGSSLLPMPCPPVTIEEESQLIRLLANNGATINQLNQVRQNVETLKGGGLARMAYADQVISLILSDVIGDPLDKIASGPTVLVPESPQKCLELFESLKIKNQVPPSVLSVLQSKLKALPPSDLPTEFKRSQKVSNVIVGCNRNATDAAFACASQKGYTPFVLTTQLEGEAREIGIIFAKLAETMCKNYLDPEKHSMKDLERFPKYFSDERVNLENLVNESKSNQKPICLICGGETTVTVRGNGKGGRNQEMVLAAALWLNEEFPNELKNLFSVQFLSAGTDGQDGPTDVAGCSVSSNMVMDGSARHHLTNNDAFNYFLSFLDGQCFVKTGLTATNVMDIQLLIINRIKE